MLGFLDFLHDIFDSLVYWRLLVGVALTGLACWLIIVWIASDTAQWLACAPVALVGVYLSYRWQNGAELGH